MSSDFVDKFPGFFVVVFRIRRMRWSEFFSNLEYDFTQDDVSHPTGTAEDGAESSYLLDVCALAKATGGSLAVGLVTGDILHVSPRAVSTQWFSGLVGGEGGSGVVIPRWGLDWVDVAAGERHRKKDPPLTVTLRDVVTDMASRAVSVTVRTRHGDWRGVIAQVGFDYCDVAGRHHHLGVTTRRFPYRAIVAVFQGSDTWG